MIEIDTPLSALAALQPAPVLEAQGQDNRAPSDLLPQIQKLEADWGLQPWTRAGTAPAVTEAYASMVQGWLKIGLYLLREQAMQGEGFWAWFDSAGLPFRRNFAYQAIATARAVAQDPTLARLAKRVSSLRAFQVLSKRLAEPQAREEFEAAGTVCGRQPEDVKKADAEALARESKPDRATDAASKEELWNRVATVESEARRLRQEASDAADQLGRLRAELLKHTNPDLNSNEIRADFRKEANEHRARALVALSWFRPTTRRDWEALSAEEAILGYGNLLILSKTVTLRLSEWEARFGHLAPSILLGEDGQPRAPLARAALRLLENEVAETYGAVNRMEAGGAVTLIDGGTGEVLAEIGGQP